MTTTKEKAISFCRTLIPRVMDGSKTMTRRVPIKPKRVPSPVLDVRIDVGCPTKPGIIFETDGRKDIVHSPYQVGDILWVREEYYEYGHWMLNGKTKTGKDKMEFAPRKNYHLYPIYYPDTLPPGTKIVKGRPVGEWGYFWRNPRFMPRYAARLFLRVTGVRVERLQEITTEDAIREGFTDNKIVPAFSAREMFIGLWDGLNEKRGYGWEANPYVFVVEFERVTEGK